MFTFSVACLCSVRTTSHNPGLLLWATLAALVRGPAQSCLQLSSLRRGRAVLKTARNGCHKPKVNWAGPPSRVGGLHGFADPAKTPQRRNRARISVYILDVSDYTGTAKQLPTRRPRPRWGRFVRPFRFANQLLTG